MESDLLQSLEDVGWVVRLFFEFSEWELEQKKNAHKSILMNIRWRKKIYIFFHFFFQPSFVIHISIYMISTEFVKHPNCL